MPVGKNLSEVRVSHVNSRGFWLCIEDKEYFLPYKDFSWFKQAKVKEVLITRRAEFHGLARGYLQSYPLKYE